MLQLRHLKAGVVTLTVGHYGTIERARHVMTGMRDMFLNGFTKEQLQKMKTLIRFPEKNAP